MKADFRRFSAFYYQRLVTATWTNPSSWSIDLILTGPAKNLGLEIMPPCAVSSLIQLV